MLINGSKDKKDREILIGIDEEKELTIYNQLWDIMRELYQDTRAELQNDKTMTNDEENTRSKPSLL